MLTTLVVMETMNSWRPSDSITVRECVRLHGPLKPEPLNGSQPVRPGRRSMQTPQWGSGAWMRSKVQIVTALTMRSASSVLKVCSFFPETTFTNFFFSIFWCLHNYLCFFIQILLWTFRLRGASGQTGPPAPLPVTRWVSKYVPETAFLILCLALDPKLNRGRAVDLSVRHQVSLSHFSL